jgi:hypothetical protein
MLDPIELLARDDKWYLGAGDGTIFAPTYPVWLDTPGFWDEATVYQYAFAPLFTITVLNAAGEEITARATSRRWTPADLTVTYKLGSGITATEVRTVHPGGVFVSEWRFACFEPTRIHLVAWTAQDGASVPLGESTWANGALRFPRVLSDRREQPLRVRAELACVGDATSWGAWRSEKSAAQPVWRYTPFVEKWRAGALPGEVRDEGINPDGMFYAAVHRAVDIEYQGASAVFAMKITADDEALRVPDATRAVRPTHGTIAGASRRRWHAWFERVPQLSCSDPYIETYYWYRWYGLHLNATAAGHGNHRWPSMCEGPGFFHQPISYSAQCHARELRWLDDPAHAQGVLRTFFGNQKDDGSLHGRVYANHLTGTDYYHADWGGALMALDAAWPDDAFIAELYPAMARFAEWMVRTRDADGTGMIDVVDQYETGQEYMSRYQAVDPDADRYGWENRLRFKGIDVTVYAYVLFRTLERYAERGGGNAARWKALATRTRDAVRDEMWDDETGMFSDVHPGAKGRTGVKAAVCFYPYFTDIVDESHVKGLKRSLLNPKLFWTDFPVPSSSLDDPLFNAEAEWKGKRHACPWNGRTWPMTNSHMVEALAATSRLGAPTLRKHTGGLIKRFVRMMFHDGDLRRPNCFEQYNPFTGHAAEYRGIDDYQHSWVADLILQYVAGVRPHERGVTIDPFPCGLEQLTLSGVRVRGRTIEVRIVGDRFTVISGGDRFESTIGEAVELSF